MAQPTVDVTEIPNVTGPPRVASLSSLPAGWSLPSVPEIDESIVVGCPHRGHRRGRGEGTPNLRVARFATLKTISPQAKTGDFATIDAWLPSTRAGWLHPRRLPAVGTMLDGQDTALRGTKAATRSQPRPRSRAATTR